MAMVGSAREECGSVRVGKEKIQRLCGRMTRLKLHLGERRLLGRGCWQLPIKRQKKDVWKRT